MGNELVLTQLCTLYIGTHWNEEPSQQISQLTSAFVKTFLEYCYLLQHKARTQILNTWCCHPDLLCAIFHCGCYDYFEVFEKITNEQCIWLLIQSLIQSAGGRTLPSQLSRKPGLLAWAECGITYGQKYLYRPDLACRVSLGSPPWLTPLRKQDLFLLSCGHCEWWHS